MESILEDNLVESPSPFIQFTNVDQHFREILKEMSISHKESNTLNILSLAASVSVVKLLSSEELCKEDEVTKYENKLN